MIPTQRRPAPTNPAAQTEDPDPLVDLAAEFGIPLDELLGLADKQDEEDEQS